VQVFKIALIMLTTCC